MHIYIVYFYHWATGTNTHHKTTKSGEVSDLPTLSMKGKCFYDFPGN